MSSYDLWRIGSLFFWSVFPISLLSHFLWYFPFPCLDKISYTMSQKLKEDARASRTYFVYSLNIFIFVRESNLDEAFLNLDTPLD